MLQSRQILAFALSLTIAGELRAAGIADQEVAFVSRRDGNLEIYLRCLDGREINLTNHPASDSGMSWSPDGGSLAFATRRDGNEEIHVLDLATGVSRNLSGHPATDTQPKWSPDGRFLAFVSDRDGTAEDPLDRREIHLLELASGQVRRLTRNDLYEEVPAWTADGRSLIFCRMRPSNAADDAVACDLWKIDLDGGERRLTDRAGFSSSPDPSRAGAPILFHGREAGRHELLALEPLGGAVTNLTGDAREDWQPAWSHDGTEIVWCAGERPNEYDLWVMKSDGTDRRLLVGGPGRDEWPVPRPVAAKGGPCAGGDEPTR